MIFIVAKRLGSRRELKKINKICAKVSKKHESSSRSISSSGSGSYLSSDIAWEKRRQPVELKEMNKLYRVVINNIKNKYQCNDAI